MNVKNVFASYAVKDIKIAEEFYSQTLGLKAKIDQKMGLLIIDLGDDKRIMIYPKDDHQPALFTVFNMLVDDIDQAVDELGAKGINFDRYEGFKQDEKGIARDDELGPPIAWFKDPSANILAVMQDV